MNNGKKIRKKNGLISGLKTENLNGIKKGTK